MAAVLERLLWIWGDDGKFVIDDRHLWLLREGGGADRDSALRLMIAQIDSFAVAETADRRYRVRPVLTSLAKKPGAELVQNSARDAIEMPYEEYWRLCEWARSRGLQIKNPSKDQRNASIRRSVDPPTSTVVVPRPARPTPREFVDVLDRSCGIATVGELVAALGTRLEAWGVDSKDDAAVVEAFAAVSASTEVRGRLVVVRRQEGKQKGRHRKMMKVLAAIDAHGRTGDPIMLREQLKELRRFAAGSRFRALCDALGLARSESVHTEGRSRPRSDHARSSGKGVLPELPDSRAESRRLLAMARDWPVSMGSIVRVSLDAGEQRINGVCDTSTGRTRITSGALDGRNFLDPTSAAIAAVGQSRPGTELPTDGWAVWVANGRTLAELVGERATR
ncbi:hypothetical protein ACE11G_06095 [Gordonia sp. PS3]|uniref:hypothetical protein n=1 Tax=Gordonia sp. PS3 TaxID=3248841 RepID=UPI0035C24E9C